MATLHVLRVFTASDGLYGNPLGVCLRGAGVADPRRQALAAELGFSETVFVDGGTGSPQLRIFTPAQELSFAGHPCVGAAWLLASEGTRVDSLRVAAGDAPVRHDAELTWIAAAAAWVAPFDYRQLESPAAVEALDANAAGGGEVYCWAWEDEARGRIRSRAFFPDFGIAEDEATGSAALALCSLLGRPIDVRQGEGSRIFARPLSDGWAEVGGRCALDSVRRFEAG